MLCCIFERASGIGHPESQICRRFVVRQQSVRVRVGIYGTFCAKNVCQTSISSPALVGMALLGSCRRLWRVIFVGLNGKVKRLCLSHGYNPCFNCDGHKKAGVALARQQNPRSSVNITDPCPWRSKGAALRVGCTSSITFPLLRDNSRSTSNIKF